MPRDSVPSEVGWASLDDPLAASEESGGGVMAVRIRQNGRIFCAAMRPAELGDIYIDDGLHYRLSVELGLLVTETMEAGHREHGEWWWRGLIPPGVEIDSFYRERSA